MYKFFQSKGGEMELIIDPSSDSYLYQLLSEFHVRNNIDQEPDNRYLCNKNLYNIEKLDPNR